MTNQPATGTYYRYDPTDPDAPRLLEDYHGIAPGDLAAYRNPAWQQPDGRWKTGGMDGVYRVEELAAFFDGPDLVMTQAILDQGTWEVSADNLELVATAAQAKAAATAVAAAWSAHRATAERCFPKTAQDLEWLQAELAARAVFGALADQQVAK